MTKKYVIYSSVYHGNEFNETKAEILAENPEYVEILTKHEIDNRVYDIMRDNSEIIFDNALHEIDIDTDNKLIAYGDIQLWYGKVFGISILDNNFKSALTELVHHDIFELYVDLENGELKAIDAHHDGVNRLTLRELRANANTDKIEELALSSNLSYEDMDKYTKKNIS